MVYVNYKFYLHPWSLMEIKTKNSLIKALEQFFANNIQVIDVVIYLLVYITMPELLFIVFFSCTQKTKFREWGLKEKFQNNNWDKKICVNVEELSRDDHCAHKQFKC